MFVEFNVPTSLGLWVWLFPVPPILTFFAVPGVTQLLFGYAVAILFFVPGLVAAVHARKVFQTAGTDRVDRAQRIADEAVLGGVIGVLVVLVCCSMYWLVLVQAVA